MKKQIPFLAPILLAALVSQSSSHAAFLVEAYQPTGKGAANFSTLTITNGRSAGSAAAGCQSGWSIFGGSSPYVFKYTPGVDADNYAPSPGLFLGNTWTNWGSTNVYATGAAGGAELRATCCPVRCAGPSKCRFLDRPSTS